MQMHFAEEILQHPATIFEFMVRIPSSVRHLLSTSQATLTALCTCIFTAELKSDEFRFRKKYVGRFIVSIHNAMKMRFNEVFVQLSGHFNETLQIKLCPQLLLLENIFLEFDDFVTTLFVHYT